MRTLLLSCCWHFFGLTSLNAGNATNERVCALLGGSMFHFIFWLTGSLRNLKLSHLLTCDETGDADFCFLYSFSLLEGRSPSSHLLVQAQIFGIVYPGLLFTLYCTSKFSSCICWFFGYSVFQSLSFPELPVRNPWGKA